MAGYYNPYNFYQNNYPNANNMSFSPYNTTLKPMEWVEGEVAAKAYQMPAGLPANQPIPLWDSTDTVIYLKSWSPMGFPNPLQKLRYEMPEQQQTLPGQSGNVQNSPAPENQNGTNYVTKDDFEYFRNELREIKEALSRQNMKNQRYKQEG